METYRSAIVGLTGIGARRPPEPAGSPLSGAMPRSHAAAYHRHPQTELVAVCDIRQEALDACREDWNDVWPELRCYTDYQEMLEQEQPDLVSVATPDHLHADITVDACAGSARAVLCEKPIATTLADADRMIAAAEESRTLLSIEHTRRWDPGYHAARELVRSGEIGPLRSITASLHSRRAMLFRNGTHSIDAICFFAASDPLWVFAELEEGFDHFTEYKSDGGHDPATDPAASAYIQFANGVRGFFDSLKITMPGSQVEVQCDEGRLEVSDREVVLVQGSSHWERSRKAIPIDSFMYTLQLGAVAELVRVLEEGGELVSPAREARKTLQIMLGILKSHECRNVRVELG